MFNHIRKVPYVAGNGKGGVSYFAGGFSNQYGLETQIVAAMCKLLEFIGGPITDLFHRWNPLVCYDFAGLEGSTYIRPQDTAGCRYHLGGGDFCYV